MTTIYIDDQAYEVDEGQNVLEAALEAGLDLPYFCWHPAMGSVGACRQCAVVQYRDEEDTRGRIVMGCMTAATDGARFSMQGEKASEFRENIVESLMINHPHDCPVCAEGGECHLQDMTVLVGHRDRRYRGKKNTHRNQYLGPLINHEMNRCIACYRCTRFYRDYAGGTDLAALAAHDHVYFGRHEEGVLESEFAGNLVEVCPTGVFTDKPLVNDYTRKWDMQSAPSICGGCAVGCNTMPGERYGELKRVHNRYNHDVNGYFLCDRGRYGHDYVDLKERTTHAGVRADNGRFDAVDRDTAIVQVAAAMRSGRTVGVGSPRASLETNFLLQSLVGAENFCTGMADAERELVATALEILRSGAVCSATLKEVEDSDAVLILGEDVTATAPRLALSLRQSARNKARQLAAEMRIPDWQDDAIRTLAQEQKSPITIASFCATRLDDIATHKLQDHEAGIARFGFAVAAAIDTTLPSVTGLDDDVQQLAQSVAEELCTAQHPLVVSGSGAQSIDVLKAASAVAHALQNRPAQTQSDHSEDAGNNGSAIYLCVPEVNSMGAGLVASDVGLSLADLAQQAQSGEVQTLVIAENDLFRRAPAAQVNALLQNVPTVVVLDALATATMEAANIALPAATLIEAEGTVVNCEGRAQRHYPVFLAAEQRAPAWQWLTRIGQALNRHEFAEIKYFDDVNQRCAASHPVLASITEAAPNAQYRNHGLKIPRQTHRYSGRTAMLANVSVHEPKQPEDTDSPLAFTMEGRNDDQPGALLPFVWSPGWNSNQSLHKFQAEIGGALRGGTAGIRLLEPRNASNLGRDYQVPAEQVAASSPTDTDRTLRVLPGYRIFGSEELSARCTAIQELVEQPFLAINPAQAEMLNLTAGDAVLARIDEAEDILLQITVQEHLPDGHALLCVGLPQMPYFALGSSIAIGAAVTEPAAGGANV